MICRGNGQLTSYNPEKLEFIEQFKKHEPAQVDLLTYLDDGTKIRPIKWYRIMTDGTLGYAFEYSNKSQQDVFRRAMPIIFDTIESRQGVLSTIYEVGVKDSEEKFKLFELSDNYFPGKSILNRKEQEIYKQYQETKDDGLLKDMPQTTIAKFYVQADLDSDYETQYALMVAYDPESKMIGWTKEDHLEYAKERTGEESKIQVLKGMGDVGKGKFIQQSEQEGYIEYECYDEETGQYLNMGFQLEKNEEGIWKVCFMPIQ